MYIAGTQFAQTLKVVDTSMNGSNTTSDMFAKKFPIISISGSGVHAFYFHGPSLFCEVIIVLLFCFLYIKEIAAKARLLTVRQKV